MDCIKPLNQENLIQVFNEHRSSFLGVQEQDLIERIQDVFSRIGLEEPSKPALFVRNFLNSFKENTIQKEQIQEIFRKEFGVFIFSPAEANKLTSSLFENRKSWISEDEDTILCIEDFLPEDYIEVAKIFLRPFIEKIIQCSKEGRAPCFEFLQDEDGDAALNHLHVLFDFLDYTCMGEFQKAYLEPFNRKFPWLDLKYAPPTIKQLDLKAKNISSIDFSPFTRLEEIDLSRANNVTPEQILQISARVKKLDLSSIDVSGFDFSRFTDLEEIELSGAAKLIPEQALQISARVKKLGLWAVDVSVFDFSRFTDIDEIVLSRAINLTPEQIGQISARVKKLDLSSVDISGFDFSGFVDLEEINLAWARNLTLEQTLQISAGVKKLVLCGVDISDLDFSRFVDLEEIDLTRARNFTPEQILQLSARVLIHGRIE